MWATWRGILCRKGTTRFNSQELWTTSRLYFSYPQSYSGLIGHGLLWGMRLVWMDQCPEFRGSSVEAVQIEYTPGEY